MTATFSVTNFGDAEGLFSAFVSCESPVAVAAPFNFAPPVAVAPNSTAVLQYTFWSQADAAGAPEAVARCVLRINVNSLALWSRVAKEALCEYDYTVHYGSFNNGEMFPCVLKRRVTSLTFDH